MATQDRMGVVITVVIGTRPWVGQSATWAAGIGKAFFLFLENIHTGSGAHRPSCGNRWLFPRRHGGQGVKTTHRLHLMPRMNEICLPSIWLYGMQRNVTFLLQQGMWISLRFRSFKAPYSLSRWREWPCVTATKRASASNRVTGDGPNWPSTYGPTQFTKDLQKRPPSGVSCACARWCNALFIANVTFICIMPHCCIVYLPTPILPSITRQIHKCK
jgi:hypothetical protein